MRKLFILSFFLLPLTGLAQYTISGRVISDADKKPVADASVFLNNATVGAKTSDNGAFILNDVRPGQYDLIVSIVGFETFHKIIMVNSEIHLPDIDISPKIIHLKEVTIGPKRNWEKDYETFKTLFIGTSRYADQCKILNPHLLDFDYDPSTKIFSAKSSDFLEIENKALGYKIKYLLTDFTNDNKTGILYFDGRAAFAEIKGPRSQQLQWQKNRLSAYLGSSMHFLRSAISNTLGENGFTVLRLIRKPNPDYIIGVNDKYLHTLVNIPTLSAHDIVKPTTVKGQFALRFSDCLYVTYDKKRAFNSLASTVTDVPEYLDDPTVTTIIFEAPCAYFDYNGIIINSRSVVFDGAWGVSRVAELLPVDYVP